MAVPLDRLLGLVRQVFNGEVTRTELAQRSAQEAVFVGVAIMLVVGEPFIYHDSYHDNWVLGHYNERLEYLLVTGTFNFYQEERRHWHESDLSGASLRSGWHKSFPPGKGGRKDVKLAPPPELEALVVELGRTPAIDRFLQDAENGLQQAEAWRTAANAEYAVSLQRSRLDEVYRNVVERLDEGQIRELCRRLEYWLTER